MVNDNRIFIDADAFVALANASDSNHRRAVTASQRINNQGIELATSSFAIGEAITVISQRCSVVKAVEFGRKIYEGEIFIIDANRVHQLNALEKFALQRSKNARFTASLNMVLMDELGVKTIFSFDKHYKKARYQLFG